jgi:hypothetical protein
MGIQYATLSLWIHGRTSQGLSRLTEAQIAEWIQYVRIFPLFLKSYSCR